MMERNRTYLKFVNFFSTTVHSASSARRLSTWPASNVALNRRCYLRWSFNISINSLNQSPTLATPDAVRDKIHKNVQKTKSARLRFIVKKHFASLLKAYRS